MPVYLLYESAAGYGLFLKSEFEDIGGSLPEVQAAVDDFGLFNKMVKLAAFAPFRNAEDALENINAISEGAIHEYLSEFLERNLPVKDSDKKKKKKGKVQLGVSDGQLAKSIDEDLGIGCVRDQTTIELLRGIRFHFSKFIKEIQDQDVVRSQLGLSHSYSRSKIKFNINRADNHIIQTIAILDQLDKDINTFAMRVKEWYSWHFPELARIVSDNIMFARAALKIGNKSNVTDELLEPLEELVGDEALAKEIVEAARTSMGTDISDFDMLNVSSFAKRVVSLGEYRQRLHTYLVRKMSVVAPNLAALIGELVAARLIAHAGSLTNLAKYPASTVQILGAEKALFRALKTKSNTPKYGIIFHATFIGRAAARDKGRISRCLANKCSLASRIDSFSDVRTSKYGEMLREQVEDRLKFYDSGVAPKKNVDVMMEAKEAVEKEVHMADDDGDEEMVDVDAPAKQGKRKRKRDDDDSDEDEAPATKKSKKSKKEKKEKKEKKDKKDKKKKKKSK